MFRPQAAAPVLEIPLAGGGVWSLAEQKPERFTLIVFYRGFHCPICKRYLQQLESLLDRYAEVGVTSVIAISGDEKEPATRTVEEWDLARLLIGYGQSIESMREWGLFVSRKIKESEPDLFGEPGLFLIRPDGTVFAAILNTMPFGRPHLDELIGSIKSINERDYPARGES